MASTSSPAYAYVFSHRLLPDPPLSKLGVGHDLSRLHTKHWGRSIDEDESKWVGTHKQLPDIDESEVVRGCFALHLDVGGFNISKLWVRKDYIRIYDHCSSYCESTRNDPDEHLPPSAVITGQPGVGERCASPHGRFIFKHTLIPKRENILDPLCRTPTPWRSQAVSLVHCNAVVFICTRRCLPHPWLFEFQLVCSLPLGVYRFERLSTRPSVRGLWAAIQTLHHIRYISPTTSMAGPNAEYISESFDHESLDVGRDRQSVKFLTLMSSSLADHPVPLVPTSIISQSPSAHMPKRYSWNMGPFLDSASIMSKIHPNSICIKRNLT